MPSPRLHDEPFTPAPASDAQLDLRPTEELDDDLITEDDEFGADPLDILDRREHAAGVNCAGFTITEH